jgi:Beta-propeller repeat
MRGPHLSIITLSLILAGACGQRRTVMLDGAIGDAPLQMDKGIDAPGVDQSAPAASWAVSAGGKDYDRGFGIAIDNTGNSYVTGEFGGTVTFGSTTLTSKGWRDAFVAKLSPSGKFLWAVSAGGSDHDSGFEIAVDNAGNSYVTGEFGGTATFGATSFTSKGWRDAFAFKLSPAGKFLWAVSAGGNSGGHGIAVDNAGNSYVTGGFVGTVSFGSIPLTSKGKNDVFVVKLSPSGKPLWAISVGGSAWEEGVGIAADNAGNSYITGFFNGTVTIGSTTLTSKGWQDIFVFKLSSSGIVLWATAAGGSSWDSGSGIAVDNAGNSYVTGDFDGKATFGYATLTSKGKNDLFVAKLSPSGKPLWAVSAGGSSADYGTGIAVDKEGNSYITGEFDGKATFGTTTLASKGTFYADAFVAKLSPSGKFLWAVSAGGIGHGITVEQAGNSYVTGEFDGTASYGTTTIASNGNVGVFIWRIPVKP